MKRTTVNNMTFTRPASRAKLQAILALCKIGATRQHIELAVGINARTANSYITFLRTTGKLHISNWTREGLGQFYPIPIYTSGPGADAPKPPRLTEHERQVRAWAKLKADPVRIAKHREKKRKTPLPRPGVSVFDWRGKPSILSELRS